MQIQIGKSNDTNIRLCKDCKNTLFSRRNFEADLHGNKKPAVIQAYEKLMPIRRSIDITLPKFQKLLAQVNDPKIEPSEETLADATKIRRKLMDGFFQLDNASRQMQKVNISTETEGRLKKQMVLDTAQYLQDHMLPLKALPKVLKRVSSNNESSSQQQQQEANNNTNDEEENNEEGENGEILSDDEVKDLQEQLIVLEEQQFLVSGMVREASSKRRFDEMIPLQQSLDDLAKEIEIINKRLGKKNQIL